MQRACLIEKMATTMPLSYTVDVRGLHYWAENANLDGGIFLYSPTARNLSFYLGPARRYYGDARTTLGPGKGGNLRGRAAFVFDRSIMEQPQDWRFSNF